MWEGLVTWWYQSEVSKLDPRVKSYCRTSLYVWDVGMMVNGFYMHRGYMQAYHFIVIVDTCMIDAS